MMKLLMQSVKGATIVEITISMMLGIFVIQGIAIVTHNLLQSYFESKRSVDLANLVNTISTYTETIINELDQHRVPILPIIHFNGDIKYNDGSRNPISNRNDSLRPANHSDAITYLSFKEISALKVLRIDDSSTPYLIYACSKYNLNNNSPAPTTESFLALNTNKLFELSGTIKSWSTSLSTNCYELSLKAEAGMVSSPLAPSIISSLNLIYPIMRIYTLYLDQTGTLRFLGHKGKGNIENQPIQSGIGTLKFILSHPFPHLVALRSTVRDATLKNTYSFSGMNRLSRHPIINLVVN